MYMYLKLGFTNMDNERFLKELINEYHDLSVYHDNLTSKAHGVLRQMKDVLKQMKELEDDEIR